MPRRSDEGGELEILEYLIKQELYVRMRFIPFLAAVRAPRYLNFFSSQLALDRLLD